jgi:hypothetical protein
MPMDLVGHVILAPVEGVGLSKRTLLSPSHGKKVDAEQRVHLSDDL